MCIGKVKTVIRTIGVVLGWLPLKENLGAKKPIWNASVLNERFFFKEPKVEQNPEFWHRESPKYFDDDFESNKTIQTKSFWRI